MLTDRESARHNLILQRSGELADCGQMGLWGALPADGPKLNHINLTGGLSGPGSAPKFGWGNKKPPRITARRQQSYPQNWDQAEARLSCGRAMTGSARRAIRASRRRPRSHGIRVLQLAASAKSVFIQRRSVFMTQSLSFVWHEPQSRGVMAKVTVFHGSSLTLKW